MQKGDNQTMALILKQYKFKNGEVNFPAIFATVPTSERLPALFKKDMFQATALVVGALTMAFKKMRLKKVDGELINDIAEDVLDSSDEDNLALEDLVLFLGNLIRGKYGDVDDITVTKFMRLFDKYRNERTDAIQELRLNEHLQFKGMGDCTRSNAENPIAESFANLGARIVEMKEALQDKREKETMVKAEQFFKDK